jgi:DUF4097 and DUF4098 domain-containing protein YvlB
VGDGAGALHEVFGEPGEVVGVQVVDHDGPVDLEATTGDLSAEGSGERLRAANTTGELDIARFMAEDVEVETTTGDAHLAAGAGTLTAQSTTGNLTVEAPESFQRIEAEATTGNVEVTLPEGADPVQVDGSSTTGNREVQVATDPGSQAHLVLTTTTGNVHVLER